MILMGLCHPSWLYYLVNYLDLHRSIFAHDSQSIAKSNYPYEGGDSSLKALTFMILVFVQLQNHVGHAPWRISLNYLKRVFLKHANFPGVKNK